MDDGSSWMKGASSLHRLVFASGLLLLAASMGLGVVESVRLWDGVPPGIPDAAAVADKLFEEGDLIGAEREYRMGDELGLDILDNSGRRVEIYERLGDNEAYLALFRAEVRQRPLDPRPHLALAAALRRKGETEEAIRVLEKLRRRSPRFPGVHRVLAFAQLEVGHCTQAETTFREGLELQPLAADLHEGLARCLERRGARAEAQRALERALQLEPDRSSARALLAELDAGGQAG